jgi:DNA invertase Pin-like site-specific DNA recombinase
MNKGQGAICYIRVSTDDQARDALNLENQERRCRDFCASRNLHVAHVFTDPGESARSADRPEFQRMLGFCRQHREEVSFIVVYDLSRFARNVRDQADAIALLLDSGVKVRSTLETNVDESPAGRLAANIHGAFNQYFSDSLSERMKERSRAAVLAGRWPWSAPLGYKNVTAREGANIVPDPKTAPHIRTAFELIATGLYTQRQVLEKITEAGLRTSRGNKLSPQTFYKTLRKKVYVGYRVYFH